MHATPSDHFAVSAVLLKRPAANRWVKASWSFLGTLPGLSETQLQQAEKEGELFLLEKLQLSLFELHCDAYHVNLTSHQPKIYLVCVEQDDTLKPVVVTVDFDEAASYMETGEIVLDAPLADALCVWLEHFVVAHYKPEMPKKRKRQKWHESEGSRS